MTELYRGLLMVLTEKFTDLISTLRVHIRLFRNPGKESFLDVGVAGFWNLMLEVIFTLFIISCLSAGILLTAVLAIFSYPMKAMLNIVSSVLRNVRHPQHEIEERVDPIISKDKKIHVKEKE